MIQQTREWSVRSESTLNTFYIVTRDSAGVYSCTCPNFQFRGGVCKHINKVKMRIEGKKQKNKLPGME
jgi:uncharacterized Zn finger protein